MSYAAAGALQTAVYQLLVNDSALAALVDGIHDAPPPGVSPGSSSGVFVVLGEETVLNRGDVSGPGAEHRFAVSVITDVPGFFAAKAAASRIVTLLTEATLALSEARLVGIWFQEARARRLEGGQLRQVDLLFRARVEITAA